MRFGVSGSTTDIVTQCLHGNEAAMRQLVAKFQPLVFSVCYRMLGHRQDAEDAVQETFTRVFKHLTSWDATRPLEPWLMAIAGNRCRTLAVKRKNRPSLQPLPAVLDWSDQEETSADGLQEELERALSSTRPEHRQAFLLFHNEKLSYEAIAQRLNCPVGTAKTWVHRARLSIIEQLRERRIIEGNNGH